MRLDRQIAYSWSLPLHVRINIKQMNAQKKDPTIVSAMQIIKIDLKGGQGMSV